MKVKICGLTSAAAVGHAADAGAAYLGFVFYPPSPRALELDTARTLVRAAPAGITRVALVVDADGLYPFAREPDGLRERRAPTVLTPHPGEAATLLGIETSEVNRDRPAAARELFVTSDLPSGNQASGKAPSLWKLSCSACPPATGIA